MYYGQDIRYKAQAARYQYNNIRMEKHGNFENKNVEKASDNPELLHIYFRGKCFVE